MRNLLVIVTLLAAFCPAAVAGPKEDALQVLERWTKAFADSDVDGIVWLYAADTLFMGTGSKTLVTKSSEIRSNLSRHFSTIVREARRWASILSSCCPIQP